MLEKHYKRKRPLGTTACPRGRFLFGLPVFPYLFHGLACLFRHVGRCGVADGNDGHGIPFLRDVEQFLAELHAEVAHPARSQALFGSSEAQVLDGDGQVDVGVILLVVAACPGLATVFAGQDVGRCFAEPFAVVALLQACAVFFCGEEGEFLRLSVHGRRGQPRAFFDVFQFLCRNGVRLVGAHGIARLAK